MVVKENKVALLGLLALLQLVDRALKEQATGRVQELERLVRLDLGLEQENTLAFIGKLRALVDHL